MSTRTYAIPTLQALSVTLGAAACSPSIMGTWELTELNGEETSQSYSSGDCSYSFDLELGVDMNEKDGDKVLGSFDQKVTYTYNCYGYSDSYSASYDGDVEATTDDGEEWEVEIDGDDASFDLTCTVDGDEMECEDDDDNNFLFERG
jgi:hypothetical protein